MGQRGDVPDPSVSTLLYQHGEFNWQAPETNDFAIAEEVTLRGHRARRPDIVLYVNGIAVGGLELQCSSVSIGDGIRQSLSNQQPEFNA